MSPTACSAARGNSQRPSAQTLSLCAPIAQPARSRRRAAIALRQIALPANLERILQQWGPLMLPLAQSAGQANTHSQPVSCVQSAGRGRTRLKKANPTASCAQPAHTLAFKAPSQSSRAQAAALVHTPPLELSSAWHAAQAISPLQEQHHAQLVQTASFQICRAPLSVPLAVRGNIRNRKQRLAALNVRTVPQASTLRFKVLSPSEIAPPAQRECTPIQDQTNV